MSLFIPTPLLGNGCFFGFSPIASPHPAMLRGTARERLMSGLLLSLFFQPLRPSDTSPIFCVAKHRGGGLMPFCRIILANDMDCIFPSPPLQFFIEDRGYSSGLLHSKLICRTLLSPLPVFSNPSVTMCPLPLLYGCATPCKVTGVRQGRRRILIKLRRSKTVQRETFNPLPLLIADEIGGVPAGRGGWKDSI